MDSALRALERAARSDPALEERLSVELERAGVLAALQRDVEALLAWAADRIPRPRLGRGYGDPPFHLRRIALPDVAAAVREVTAGQGTWRLVAGDHLGQTRTLYAVVALEGDTVVISADHGDTVAMSAREAELARDEGGPGDALMILGPASRRRALRIKPSVAGAWSRWYRNRGPSDLARHARTRPAMYVGSLHQDGVQHLVEEVLDHALARHAAGLCRRILARRLGGGAWSIEDDGPGIPDVRDDRTGVPLIEALFTTHTRRYVPSGGLHGVGLEVVNALSAWLEVESHHEGLVLHQRFERGVPVAAPERRGAAGRTALAVAFRPDASIFTPSEPSFERVSSRLRELSRLRPGLEASVEDLTGVRPPARHVSARGLADALEPWLAGEERLLEEPLRIVGQGPGKHPVFVDAVITWIGREVEQLESWVNDVPTADRGTHVAGLRAGVERVSRVAGARKRGRAPLFRAGLTAAIAVRVPEPQFLDSKRTRLGNSEVEPIVSKLVSAAVRRLVEERPDEAERVVERALARSPRRARH
jgi:hypothetical protein